MCKYVTTQKFLCIIKLLWQVYFLAIWCPGLNLLLSKKHNKEIKLYARFRFTKHKMKWMIMWEWKNMVENGSYEKYIKKSKSYIQWDVDTQSLHMLNSSTVSGCQEFTMWQCHWLWLQFVVAANQTPKTLSYCHATCKLIKILSCKKNLI